MKTLVHAGNIFDFQNPIRLWHYLKQYNATCEEKIRVQFIGTVSPAIRRSIEEYGLGKQTEFLGFLPYSEMINRISGADYLLVCVTEKRHIPGKLFEYLRTGRRILAFGADNEEVREILRKSGAGKLLGYDESPADFFSDNNPLQRDDEYISTFERQSGALNFARLLH
jgi:glycosyltransferase involved in cell wall biosynthesis